MLMSDLKQSSLDEELRIYILFSDVAINPHLEVYFEGADIRPRRLRLLLKSYAKNN